MKMIFLKPFKLSSKWVILNLIVSLAIINAGINCKETTNNSKYSKKIEANEKCFCELNEYVDDCFCKIESIDKFNNYKFFPLITNLVQKDYFRFVKVNMNKICEFWPDDAKCSLRDCHIKVCNEDEIPEAFRKYINAPKENISKIMVKKEIDSQADCEQKNPLGHLNQTLSEENLKVFEDWKKFDEAQDNFCESDDENLSKADYVDLLTNPERYTGYKGAHAHKIWNSIYRENCFEKKEFYKPAYGPENNLCLEKRIFYRLISGLHASINIHLSAEHLFKGGLGQPDYWGRNVDEFKLRFHPETTNGQGPHWLKNLYFIYLVELRALAKVAPYLEREIFYAGKGADEDEDTKILVNKILKISKEFEYHFDERSLFKGNENEAKRLKNEFKHKFRNITRIMDCVGCDKCRLWGKVQTLALGTSLKILFSGKPIGLDSTVELDSKQSFQLSRSEIVALFNGIARLSTSITEIENFRELIAKEKKIGREDHDKNAYDFKHFEF